MDLSQLDIPLIAMKYAILLLSLTVHETAHAWTANRFGDPTARALGRISLNPLPHIDPVGTVLFPLLQFVSPGLPVLGWAKPVPVNPLNLRDPRRMGMWISAAGPLSNLALATLFFLALAGAVRAGFVPVSEIEGNTIGSAIRTAPLAIALMIGILSNVMLAFFNLLPIPPLDGGGVAAGVLPARAASAVASLGNYGFLLLLGLMVVPVGGSSLLGWILTPADRVAWFAVDKAFGA